MTFRTCIYFGGNFHIRRFFGDKHCYTMIYLGMFYYFIGNIDPKLRSALKCTQLIACVSVPDLKMYGFDKVLQPFIEDANKLAEVGLHSACMRASS